MSKPDIRELDARTIERIAAGEVIERPASAVKELVENSLDAGADRVEVTVEEGGVARIAVTDDGHGIRREELASAVEKHTTSKLRDVDHLAGGIETLGFRGEALHTIGAVSRMTITSRRPDDEEGAKITVEGGDVGTVEPAGAPPGTTVEVADLFYNTPARRAFLGATETEFDHVNRVVTEYALANPDVAFVLTHGEREVFRTPGRDNLQEAILAVWGREVAESMVAVDYDESTGPIAGIGGMIGDPETTRSRPRYLATFVNGRAVRSSAIREGILEGYGTELGPDRYPFVVLFCTIQNDAVDVNVHPRKTEVRFEDPEAVTSAVAGAIRESIREAGWIRTTAPRGRGAPAETTVPSFDSGSTNEAREPARDDPARGSESTTYSAPTEEKRTRPATTQRTFEDAEPEPAFAQLPTLRLLGQVAETFIVGESDDGLVLIDQHAADERIQYERLQEAFERERSTQTLVAPVTIELTGAEAAGFPYVSEALERLGFAVEPAGERALQVTGVPAVLDATLAPERIQDAVQSAIEAADAEAPIEATADAMLADMACHPAITGNEPLAEGSMVELLEALDDCEDPRSCPHGRPTVIRIDMDELGDRFERDYPGHAVRRHES